MQNGVDFVNNERIMKIARKVTQITGAFALQRLLKGVKNE